MRPREAARAIRRLRGTTLLMFDDLEEHEFAVEVLPGWTAFDVFAHLAASDRGAVLGSGLRQFLPTRSIPGLEADNDVKLQRFRRMDRLQLRHELDVWGRRLATMISPIPATVGKLPVRTVFGRGPLSLLAGLRLHDEWVHNYDLAVALDRAVPEMDGPLADLLAEANLQALAADPITKVHGVDGVVEIDVAGLHAWRFDLAAGRQGPKVRTDPTAHVRIEVPTLCLVAAKRQEWREQMADGHVAVDDDEQGSAAAVLDELYFV